MKIDRGRICKITIGRERRKTRHQRIVADCRRQNTVVCRGRRASLLDGLANRGQQFYFSAAHIGFTLPHRQHKGGDIRRVGRIGRARTFSDWCEPLDDIITRLIIGPARQSLIQIFCGEITRRRGRELNHTIDDLHQLDEVRRGGTCQQMLVKRETNTQTMGAGCALIRTVQQRIVVFLIDQLLIDRKSNTIRGHIGQRI